MNKIPIVFVTDDGFVIPTAVAITSLIENKSTDSTYEIYIISDKLSEENKEKFFLFNSNSIHINLILASSDTYKNFHFFEKDAICTASLAALLKFEIPNLIPFEDKILYLDGDILIKKDLKELYETNVENVYAAVAHDSGKIYFDNGYDYTDSYFNSGVMVLNLKYMRENNTSDVLKETKRKSKDMNLMDQNVLNTIFQNDVKILDIKYNFLILNLFRSRGKYTIEEINSLFNSNYKNLKQINEEAVIVHFSSKEKPWKYSNTLYSKEWYRVFKKSPFKNLELERDKLSTSHKLYYPPSDNHIKGKFKDLFNKNVLIYIIMKEKGNPKNIYRKIRAYRKINKLKLFNTKYYLKKYPELKKYNLKPLNHYIYHGYKEGRLPSKLFDGNYYLKKYPDVKKTGQNPLVHYVLNGKYESRFKNKDEELSSPSKLYFKLKKQNKKLEKQKNEIKKQNKHLENSVRDLERQIKAEKKYLEGLIKDTNDKLYKYSKIYNMKQINRAKITSEIENFKEYGITKDKRNPKLIVSMTSYPDRMYDVHYTIYSLLKQKCKPDEILLWLSREEFPNLEEDIPKKVLELKKYGLIIKWCKDLKSYKKLFYSLQEYPNDIIVTADDDLYYPELWLEKLYELYNKDSENIICHRAHLVKFDNNEFKPYNKWKMLIQNNRASFLNFPTTGGGNLYPPNSLYKDTLNENLLKKLAPTGDDIWFWAMAILNNRKIKIIENGYNDITYVNPKREIGISGEINLYHENQTKNDTQLKQIIEYYPQIIDKLNRETYPKISIIMPIYNAEKYLKESLNSIINQSLHDIELICINDGSTDNSLKILEEYEKNDKRIKIINQKNQGAPIAINNGFKVANGEYIGFVDADDWVDLNFFELLYYNARAEDADIARTLYKYNWADKEIEEKHLNTIIREKNSKKELLEINDHSVVNWNAIYKRKFLEENKINYYDNIIVYDVPFTTRATYFSKKTIPVVGNAFYHHREEVENQMTVFSLKRIHSANEANKISLEFLNSHDYKNKEDYLVAFKRCMWRYDHVFNDALDLEEFDENEQKKFFNDFVSEFKKCNYPEDFEKDYYEEYFKFMDKKLFKDYLKYKKNIKFRKNFKSSEDNFSSKNYWENRYKEGKNSGSGSYGFLSEFKAEIINNFVEKNNIKSVIEFGHGDGNQLKLANYKNYIGFDVSETIVSKCREKFKNDKTKKFYLLNEYNGQKANLALSLDVIFHLIEDNVYENYMKTLFNSSNQYIIIYSSNTEKQQPESHVKHRVFTEWVEKNKPEWKLMKKIPNKYPFKGEVNKGSFSDFYFYKRIHH